MVKKVKEILIGGEALSLKEDYKTLSREEQIKALIHDTELVSSIDKKILSDSDQKVFDNCIKELIKYQNVKTNVSTLVSTLKKYPDIPDYKILSLVIWFSDFYNLSKYEFVDTILMKPFYGDAPKTNSNINVTTAAAKNIGTGYLTANDIVNRCNEINQHPSDCTCGCHNQSNNPVSYAIAPVHPEMNMEQKIELIKSHINLVPNVTVKVSEVDALIRLIEGSVIRSKLKEMNAACNPSFPKLTQTTKYNFDDKLYNFAFYVETNTPDKSILVLYNTKTVYTTQGYGNEMGFILVNTSEVK